MQINDNEIYLAYINARDTVTQQYVNHEMPLHLSHTVQLQLSDHCMQRCDLNVPLQ